MQQAERASFYTGLSAECHKSLGENTHMNTEDTKWEIIDDRKLDITVITNALCTMTDIDENDNGKDFENDLKKRNVGYHFRYLFTRQFVF